MAKKSKKSADAKALADREKALASGMPDPAKTEEAVSAKLAKVYRGYLKDIKKQLKAWIEEYDKLSVSEKIAFERLMNVGNTVSILLDEPANSLAKTLKEYVISEGVDGYNSTWYVLENANGISLDLALIDPNYIKALVDNPVAGATLSTRLYKHRADLAKQTTDSIGRGLLMGYGYGKIAKEISNATEASYRRAVTIARTEGGRVRSIATQKGYESATSHGVNMKKRWLATLDAKTRIDHGELDGQTVPVGGLFTVNGVSAPGPRLFGVAYEDINCRCTTIAIVEGIAPETRLDNITKEDVEWQTYSEWLKNKQNN